MPSAKSLLWIDRLFSPLYTFAKFLLTKPTYNKKNQSDQVVVIKLMGMGSIIRFASLCEEYQVDKTNVTMITFLHHREVCGIFGFGTICIRTTVVGFLIDCFAAMRKVRLIKPSYLVDFERCSHAVSVFRVLLARLSNSFAISFDVYNENHQSSYSIYNVNSLTFKEMLLTGINLIPKLPVNPNRITLPVQHNKVLININASDFLYARRYSIVGYKDLIKKLNQENPALKFYLTGSIDEFNYTQQVVDDLKGLPIENCCGQWTIHQLIDELSSCALLITGDSGPLHLAVFLGTETLALWGPTQPEHFGYENNLTLDSLTLKLACSPCFTQPKSKPTIACHGRIDCLGQLTSDQVFKSANKILSGLASERNVNFPPQYESQKKR